jgi:hypothetical protein
MDDMWTMVIEGARRRFVLLGSSARRLKTADTNLLAGRAALRTMYPLVPAELGADFDLARVLRFGSIPVVWQADDPRAALEAYVQLYVREEIRLEALVRNCRRSCGFSRGCVVSRLGDLHCGSGARCRHRADDRGTSAFSGHAGGDAPAGIRGKLRLREQRHRNSIGSIRGWLAPRSDSWVRSRPRNADPCSKASS